MSWLHPVHVAEMFGIPLSTVHLLIRRGDIPAVRIGRRWMIPKERLEEMIERQLEERAAAGATKKAAGRSTARSRS